MFLNTCFLKIAPHNLRTFPVGTFEKREKTILKTALFCCKARNKWETRNVIDSFFPLIECSNRYLNDLQQNRAQSRRLYLFHYKTSFKFPSHYFQFFKEILFPGEQRYRQYALIEHALSIALSARFISEPYYIKKKNSASQIRLCLLILFILHWKFSSEKESYWLNSDWISVRMTAKWPVCRRVDHGWRWIDNLCRRVDMTIGHQMYSFHFFSGGVPNISNLEDSCQCPFHFHLR